MITRYSLDYENCNLEYDPEGDIVDYGDHCAVVFVLQSRLESLEKENASLKQDAVRLHNEIMNLRVNEDSAVAPYTNCREAYLWGNRDARHAAAELVVVMQANK